MNEANDSLWKLVWPIIGLYSIISQLMAIYFWYKVAQVSSFAYTVFIGPFEAELKGLLWPFFI
tara:strand:+ start:394 stop:582 length:189 start_codon:yes stop_codon:yes gene_type:complete